MRIIDEVKLDYSSVLMVPKRSTLPSRGDVDLTRVHEFKHSKIKYRGTPIIASNMDGVGTFTMAMALQKTNMFTAIKKHYTEEDWDEAIEAGLNLDHIAICTGSNAIYDSNAADYKTVKNILAKHAGVNYICIDVANGYQENFVNFVTRVRKDFPDKVIMAGNVVTPDITLQLILAGADIVKIGIGPGSVCTTRTMTGVGYPQLSAVIECADAAHGEGGHIIADGGCNSPGDVAKAFGGGADFVMLGGMLSGHKESEEEIFNEDGEVLRPATGGGFLTGEGRVFGEDEAFIEFYGMSSDEAMERHGTRKDGYRAAEGKAVLIPYKGPVEKTVVEILGGLRGCCTTIGARRIKDISKCTTFVKVHDTHNRIFE